MFQSRTGLAFFGSELFASDIHSHSKRSSLPGVILYRKKANHDSKISNAVGSTPPVLSEQPGPAPGPLLKISPYPERLRSPKRDYSQSKTIQNCRIYGFPNPQTSNIPSFWKSNEQAKDLSRVEITFDPSYDFIFDKKPRSYDTASIPF